MTILLLIAVLFTLMAVIGQNRGAKSFVVLLLNSLTVVLSLNLLGKSLSPILIMIVSSVLFCFLTIVFQNEYNLKSVAALLGTLVVIGGLSCLILFFLFGSHLTGLNEISSRVDSTEYFVSAVNLNLYEILIVSMIWGALGAIADTGISIASALHEISSHNRTLTPFQLFQSGLIIGKDIIGTTVNTLAFVAMGESILLLLLYHINHYSWLKIINSKSFLQEVSGILLSCIGCILIIPATAFFFSYLQNWEKGKKFLHLPHN